MRHATITTFVVGVFCTLCSVSQGQNVVYQPLGSWVDPRQEAYANWKLVRQTRSAQARPVAEEARPQLAGLRPKPLELFEDALLRKFSQKVRTADMAGRHIQRMSGNQAG